MNANKKLSGIYLIAVIITLLCIPSTGFAQKDLPITVASGIIPPEFNLNNDTLLVNRYAGLGRNFKKIYTGQYLGTKDNDIDSYSIEHCRYVLYEQTEDVNVPSSIGSPESRARKMTVHVSYYILDRKTNKKYVNPNIASPKLIKEYITGLEEARQMPVKQ